MKMARSGRSIGPPCWAGRMAATGRGDTITPDNRPAVGAAFAKRGGLDGPQSGVGPFGGVDDGQPFGDNIHKHDHLRLEGHRIVTAVSGD